ncbi:MAG: ribbon-helix-helix protein, CopG family [Mycobacteriales bacterium]
MTTKYPTGDDFGSIRPDINLAEEEIFDNRGNRIDDAYVEQAVVHAHEQLRRGRPSLEDTASRRSPQLTIKFPTKLKEAAAALAHQEGRTVSELVRTAVAQYLKQAA